MRQIVLISFFLYCSFFPFDVAAAENQDSAGTIVIEITGFRNNKGIARLYLHNAPDGFPKKRENAIKAIVARIEEKNARAVFDSVAFGTYAVSVHHDENGNEKVDTNFLRMPREGFGASNNPKTTFGPPKYKDSVFELKSDTLKITVEIKYLGGS